MLILIEADDRHVDTTITAIKSGQRPTKIFVIDQRFLGRFDRHQDRRLSIRGKLHDNTTYLTIIVQLTQALRLGRCIRHKERHNYT